MKHAFLVILPPFFLVPYAHARSILRKQPPTQEIHVRYTDRPSEKPQVLKDPFLDKKIFESIFDKQHFMQHMLPQHGITARTGSQDVTGQHLGHLVEKAIAQLMAGKKEIEHFTVLKRKDFNRRSRSGLCVLKFNDHPFVAKIFIQTPYSFTHPYSTQALDKKCLFVMGGGMTRHWSGFTRIKNRERVLEKLSQDPLLSAMVDIPRKWFWLPKDQKWLEVTYRTALGESTTTEVPAMYALIADHVEIERQFNLISSTDAHVALDICSYLDYCIDPNQTNFVIEKCSSKMSTCHKLTSSFHAACDKKTKNLLAQLHQEQKKLVIIDTEHYPTLVGPDHNTPIRHYAQWYGQLAKKFVGKKFFSTKEQRLAYAQGTQQSSVLT